MKTSRLEVLHDRCPLRATKLLHFSDAQQCSVGWEQTRAQNILSLHPAFPQETFFYYLYNSLSAVFFCSRRVRCTLLTMRYAGYTARAAAAVGTLAAVSCSIVTEAFVTAPSLHAAVHHHRHSHNDKLRFSSNSRQPTALASTSTSPLQAAGRLRRIPGRRTMITSSGSPLGSSSPAVCAGLRVSGAASRYSQRRPRATTAVGSGFSADGGGENVLNPLARGDPERARVNNLITILAETPMNQWKPAVLDEYMSSLLKRGLYRQAMAERLAKVRSGEDQEALVRVDAYLTGYLGQESRRASRKKVRGEG